MDDAQYAVFDPLSSFPSFDWPILRTNLRRSFEKPDYQASLEPRALPPYAPAPPMSDSPRRRDPVIIPRASPFRLVASRKEADDAQRMGAAVMRIPRMPVRLIPQVDDGATPQTASDAWGLSAVGAGGRHANWQGQGVCVAILDSGIERTHPAFHGLAITDENYKDFTGRGLDDNLGHGTHCAGIIFGRPVNGTPIGVAPGITNVLIGKIADARFTTTTNHLTEGLQWAVRSGANIISLSFGLDFFGHADELEARGVPRRVALARALVDYGDYALFFDRVMGQISLAGAASNSALVIAACGNDSKAEDGMRVAATVPSITSDVIAVGALGRDASGSFQPAPFSNAGANVCAPGVGILSAGLGGSLATKSGTSQAAPHVAGIAALWWQYLQAEGSLPPSPRAVRESMIGAAEHEIIPGENLGDAIGHGLIQAPPVPAGS